MTCLPGPAAADEYRLGAQDRIKIRVLEWIASKGGYQLWDGMDGEYVVSIAGTVSIPLIGPVPATGFAPDEIASKIAQAVQAKTGLQNPPEVSVEVSQYRPVYIVGEVKSPGEYAWRPGMDVIKAIGLAGGRYRPFDDSSRFERDVISQTGVLQSVQLEIVRTRARQARFLAEANQQAEITFPEDIRNDPGNAGIMAEERAILGSRRGALSRQLDAIDQLKSFLTSEIASLQSKVVLQERQIDSARQELSSVAGLASRGLSPANRELAMDRVLAGIETERLDLSTAIIRVRQNLATADRDKITLIEERELEIARNQQDAQASLEQLYSRQHTAERLIYEAGISGPQAEANSAARRELSISYAISRNVDGKKLRIDADRDTPVLPDDVIEIIAPPAGTDSRVTDGASTGSAKGDLSPWTGGNEAGRQTLVADPAMPSPRPRDGVSSGPGAS